MECYEILLTRVWKDCLICIWNNAILFNLIYVWAFYSNRVEQFVPVGKKRLLVTERLFIVHYTTWHFEENYKDSPFGCCPSLCTKRLSKCWRKDPWRLIWGSVLDALKWRCFFQSLKSFSDPFHHSFLLLIGHFKVRIPTTSKSSMPTSINTF